MDLNKEMFRRTKPQSKLKMVEEASESDLMRVSHDTIARCVMEAGVPTFRTREQKKTSDKTLYVTHVSNGYCASFLNVRVKGRKKELSFECEGIIDNEYIDNDGFYHYMSYFDMVSSANVVECGVKYTDRKDRPHYYDFRWYRSERAECIRAILTAYINAKYHDKLCA